MKAGVDAGAGEPVLKEHAIYHATLAALDCQLGNLGQASASRGI